MINLISCQGTIENHHIINHPAERVAQRQLVLSQGAGLVCAQHIHARLVPRSNPSEHPPPPLIVKI